MLHAEVHGADRGNTPLVLVHGLGGDTSAWGAFASLLARSRRTAAVDLRGCGTSDRGTEPLTFARLARDLLAVVDALGAPKAHLLGHSLGGVIVQQFLLDSPERCRAAALLSTSSVVGEKATKSWRKLADVVETRGAVGDGGSARGFSEEFASARPDVVATHGAIAARCPARVYAEQARVASTYDYTERLAAVSNPVLVVQGLADRLTSPGGSVLLHRALPNSELRMLDGVGHNCHLEAAEMLAHEVGAFFDRHDR